MSNTPTIGIVGGGIVGGAVKNFFKDAKVYDKYKTLDPIEAAAGQRFIFICVPTPYENGLDLSMMDDAVGNTVAHLADPENQLIAIKSTVLPGTTEHYQKKYPQANFAFSPEFLRDKTAKEDFISNDRQIVGYTSKTRDSAMPAELLSLLPPAPYQKLMPSEAAEMIKYAGNNFLALQVIFANQIYDICRFAGINYDEVKQAVRSDKRIGKSHWEIFHTESSIPATMDEVYRGYGGKCFPKDLEAFIAEAKKLGVDISLFEAGREVNFQLNGGKYDR